MSGRKSPTPGAEQKKTSNDRLNERFWEFPDTNDEYDRSSVVDQRGSLSEARPSIAAAEPNRNSSSGSKGEYGIVHDEDYRFMFSNPDRQNPMLSPSRQQSQRKSSFKPFDGANQETLIHDTSDPREQQEEKGFRDSTGRDSAGGNDSMYERDSEMEPAGVQMERTQLSRSMSTKKSDLMLDQDKVVMDSIAVQFHLEVFFVQFFTHMIVPLAFMGLINFRIQGFAKCEFGQLMYNVISPFLLYASMVAYLLSPKRDQNLVSGAVWITLIYFIQHKLTVALKYASLSETEYDKFQNCRDMSVAERYFLQIQLSRGWMRRDPHLVRFELGCAASRIGAKVNEIHFNIPNPKDGATTRNEFAHWNAFIRGNSNLSFNKKPAAEFVKQPDGSYCVSVYDVAMAMVKKTDRQLNPAAKLLEQSFRNVFSLVNLAIPFMKVAADSEPETRSNWLYIFLICSTILNFFYGRVMAQLLYVGVWDTWQQWDMMKYLHDLVRLSDLSLDTKFDMSVMSASKDKQEKLQSKQTSATANMAKIFSVTKPNRRRLSSVFQDDARWMEIMKDEEEYTGVFVPGAKEPIRPKSERYNTKRFFEFGAKNVQDGEPAHAPKVYFRNSQNVVAWTYTRLLFQHFGERFRARIDAYTGGSLLLMFVLMLTALLNVIISTDPLEQFQTIYFYQSMLAVILIFGFLTVCMGLGATINEEQYIQSRTLAAHALRIRDEILVMQEAARAKPDEVDPDDIRTMYAVVNYIEHCKEITHAYSELKPYRVLGVKVYYDTVGKLVTTGISFFGVLFSLYNYAVTTSEEN